MGTWELGLTPTKFSLHGLRGVKIYDERHSQLGNRLGLVLALQDWKCYSMQSDALHTEVWGAHGFVYPSQQVWRGCYPHS